MTYDQYRTIMTALEARNQAAKNKLQRDGLKAQYLHQERETQAAISACQAAFHENPSVLIVRAGE